MIPPSSKAIEWMDGFVVLLVSISISTGGLFLYFHSFVLLSSFIYWRAQAR